MKYRELFSKQVLRFYKSMLKIGLLGFGGGTSLIPILYKETVGEFIEEKTFDENLVAASLTPGALPVEIASGIGYRLAGRIGMFVGAIAIALPGVLATIILLTCGIFDLSWIQYVSAIVSLWVIWILIKYVVYSPMKWLIAIVFILTCGKNLWDLFSLPGNAVYLSTWKVFLIAIILQLFIGDYKIKISRVIIGDFIFLSFPVLLMLLLYSEALNYTLMGCLSTLISFGGGDAYLAVVDGLFIDTKMIDKNYFYEVIVPLVNMLPGSILCKTLTAIGFVIGGWSWAILGFLTSIAVSCGVFRIAISIELKEWRWIRPVVAGLMCSVCLSLIRQVINVFF